ncbi:Flagellar M-ring protein [compost metagenome]
MVINYRGTDKDGKPLPMSKEQLAQIESLARESMGFSSARGDTLNVVNTPFTDNEITGGELPFWQSQSFIDRLIDAGRYLLILLVAWVLWRKLVRPQLQNRQAVQKAALAAAATPMAKPADSSKPSNEELAQHRKSQQRVSAEVQSQRIRDLADKDPRVVALVIRQWMSNEL